jgi:hypothetical protein
MHIRFVRMLVPLLLAALLAGAAFSVVLAAPDGLLALERWVISGGGGTGNAAPLRLDATIGQPVANRTSAGPLVLSWGYWSPSQSLFVYLPLIMR